MTEARRYKPKLNGSSNARISFRMCIVADCIRRAGADHLCPYHSERLNHPAVWPSSITPLTKAQLMRGKA